MRPSRLAAALVAALTVASLAGCGTEAEPTATTESSSAPTAQFPLTIEHALGETTIEAKPERVATVAWANHEVPLALGVVPVGMGEANFGDDDGDGLLPWVEERLEELDAETPVLFDETDGIDFEAVADTEPDVILAGYSGLTQEDYDTLSEIAPVVAYPEVPWATSWRDMIELNSQAMGMAAEGEQLVADLEEEIAAAVGRAPAARGQVRRCSDPRRHRPTSARSASTPPHDTRPAFFEDLGLTTPGERRGGLRRDRAVLRHRERRAGRRVRRRRHHRHLRRRRGLASTRSRPTRCCPRSRPSRRGSVVAAARPPRWHAAANPTPLAIAWVLDDYVTLLAEAADKARVTAQPPPLVPAAGRRHPRGVRGRSGCSGCAVVAWLVAAVDRARLGRLRRAAVGWSDIVPALAGDGDPSRRPPCSKRSRARCSPCSSARRSGWPGR